MWATRFKYYLDKGDTMIIIAAMTSGKRVIGKDGKLPWDIPEDLKNFRRLTANSTVIMGRKTFESIGRPLPKRDNIVVSSKMEQQEGVVVCKSVEEAVETAKGFGRETFVIGGSGIYKAFLPVADKMYLSFVKKEYDGDVCFPEFDESEWNIESEEDFGEFVFRVFVRKLI